MMMMMMWTSVGLGKVSGYKSFSYRESRGYPEMKQYKPWFDGRMLKIIRSKEAG
jgi:hypothetical protein